MVIEDEEIFEEFNVDIDEELDDELPPDPGRVAEGLRDTGYDFNMAISDIIDNSIAANATKIDVSFNLNPRDEINIYIADNGTGMNKAGLRNAMKYGSKQRKEKNSLGKFGLGLKTASTAFCRKLSLVSRYDDNQVLKITWDLDVIARNGWKPIKSKPTKDELKILNSIAGDGTGTLVVWEKVDRLLQKSIDEYASKSGVTNAIKNKKDKLAYHLAITFQRFLDFDDRRARNVEISIDMNKINPIDPFCVKEELTECVLEKRIKITVDGGADKYPVILKAYVLPRPEEFSTEKAKSEARVSTNTEGFYVYRENRLINYGGWFGMFTSEPHYSLLRIEFSFTEELDNTFNVDIKKSRILPADEIIDYLKDTFISAPRRQANEKYRLSQTKKTAKKSKLEDAHISSNKVIEAKASSVENSEMKQVGENEVDLKNQYGTFRHKISIISGAKPGQMRIIPVESLPNGDLWEPCLADGKHAVRINQSHPYYQKIYYPILGQKITTTGMDALLWALCEAENSNINKEVETYFEDLRVTVSRQLKKLIADLPNPIDEEEVE